MYSRHPTTLYPASHVVSSSAQISSRLRLPETPRRFGGVDTVHLVLDFPSHHVHQLRNVRAVEISRVRQVHLDLAANPARIGVQHDDSIRQPHRFADRMS